MDSLDYNDLLDIYLAGEPLEPWELAELFNVARPDPRLGRMLRAEQARPYPGWRHGGRRASRPSRYSGLPRATASRLREAEKVLYGERHPL